MNVTKKDIQVIRAVLGMKQSKFAEVVNLSRSLIEKIEAGQKPVTESTARKIFDSFHLNPKKMNSIREVINILDVRI